MNALLNVHECALEMVLIICTRFMFQVSNCLWELDVTVLVIDMKHAVKRNEEFCCCDDNDNKCRSSLTELMTCKKDCDMVFNVTVSPCTESTSSGLCSIITEGITNAEKFGDKGYYFIFRFTTTSQANNVRNVPLL